MALAPGTRLGVYEVVAAIGKGGMGEVYRARDTTLGREVALKTLPEEFAADPDRLARFEREAKLLASLNHPNIGAIYGFEQVTRLRPAEAQRADAGAPAPLEEADTRFLVLELVEGDTLADKLAQAKPGAGLPIPEALHIALQIADALEAAHEKGVIHRDLKPGNVMITTGTAGARVKVLDFGLAKAMEASAASQAGGDIAASQSPTVSIAATRQGIVLGTVPYMSPEQARGQSIDARTDIWAFGCVLFEMLTGRVPFPGDTLTDTLAQILEHEPDWTALPADTPPTVTTLLRRCLKKDKPQRLPHIGAARLELADAIATKVPDSPERPSTTREWRPPVAAVLVLLALAAGLATWLTMRGGGDGPAASAVSRLSINPSPGESWVIGPHDPDFAVSPDGERIAYIGRRADGDHLVVRRLDEFEGTSLGSFRGVIRHPFFSGDGDWIGFADGNVLKKAAVDGSATVTVCVLPGYMSGAVWGSDNTIIFGTLNNGLFRVSSAGGEPEPLDTDARAEGRSARWPALLPGGKAVLFASAGTAPNEQIRVRSLVRGEEKVLVQAATFPRYAETGHLLYVSEGVLWGVRFDADRLTTVGDPAPVVDGVMIKGPEQTGLGAANVGLAGNGTLVYRPSGNAASDANTLVWVDRMGHEEALAFEGRAYGRMQLSPDGSKLAIEITDAAMANTDIWIGDVNGTTLLQLTFDPGQDDYPLWTADGQRVIFRSERDGGGLFWKRADSAGAVERILTAARVLPYFVTPDGQSVVYIRPVEDSAGVATLPFFGLSLDETHTEQRLALVPGPVAAISPDGRWLAHSSEETGDFEVYVQPFPNPDGARWRITSGGGRDPVWSRDGRELFYENSTTVFGTRVTTQPTFVFSPAEALFDGPYVDSLGRWYDVAPDGRFLMVKPGWLSAGREAPLNIVLNWHQELLERVPID